MNFFCNLVCPICNLDAKINLLCLDCHYAVIACYDKSLRQNDNFNCFYYKWPISTLIKNFKYNNDLLAAKVLSKYALDYFENILQGYSAIIPMPSHKNRIGQRGIHAADYLIRIIVQKSKIRLPILNTYSWRVINANPQRNYNFQERLCNIMPEHFSLPELSKENYIVFDDVLTTGTTWRSFRACFAYKVALITLART